MSKSSYSEGIFGTKPDLRFRSTNGKGKSSLFVSIKGGSLGFSVLFSRLLTTDVKILIF